MLLFSSLQPVNAQGRTFTIRAGQSISDVLTENKIYRYPEFADSKTCFQDGTVHMAPMNYNIILGEMMFINPKKDTLTVSNRDDIDYIVIRNDTILPAENGYYINLAGNNEFRLVDRQYIKLTDIQKKGAYGTSSSTSAVDNYSSVSSNFNTGTYKLKVNEDVVYTFKDDFYFRLSDGKMNQANKNFLLKLFPEKKEAINKFIKDNSIKFNKKEDLVRVTSFAIQ